MNRLFGKGLITTIIGLMILLLSGILMYQQKATPESLSGWIAVGLLFLRSKDTLINIEK